MNIEIRKLANGYLVLPIEQRRRGEMTRDDQCYVFQSYAAMMDKLHEILSGAEEK